MLEYKFRAWDKLHKKMYYDAQNGITIDGEHHTFGAILKDKSRWEVMQLTGLRADTVLLEGIHATGIALYVDDIIEVCADEGESFFKRVVHKEASYTGFQFALESLDGRHSDEPGAALTTNPVGDWLIKYFDIKLLGNAWENAELLNKFFPELPW